MDLQSIGVFLMLCIPFFAATVWAIVDVLQKDFGSIAKKALWGFVAAIPFIGFIVYLIFGFRKGKKMDLSL